LRCHRPVVLEEAGPAAEANETVACPVCGNPIDTGGKVARAAGVRKIVACVWS
jgi:hypothetical protein